MKAKLLSVAMLVASLLSAGAAQTASSPTTPTGKKGHDYVDLLGNPFSAGGVIPRMPADISIVNEGGPVQYERDKNLILYEDGRVRFKTDTGLEVFADSAKADLNKKLIYLDGNLIIYQSDAESRINGIIRAENAMFDMEARRLDTNRLRMKVEGMILNSGNFEYKTDEHGKTYLEAKDASVTAEDIENPNTWISADRIRIYPQDRFEFDNMTLNYGGVPFLYFPYLSHSLNPEVGYLPRPGTRSIWGAYLLNEYGFLIGNRRVNGGIPSADYLATVRLDYRTRRGFGYGFDIKDIDLEKKYKDLSGLSLYSTHDDGYNIHSSDKDNREHLSPDRWRIALQQIWDLPLDTPGDWSFRANVNALSDEYMLRDFYPDIYQRNSSPDNTFLLSWQNDANSVMLLQRFVPNDFYIADRRTELSWERLKSPIYRGASIMHEGRASFGILKQYVPSSMRWDIRDQMDRLVPNSDAYDFWERLLMTDSYSRFHTYQEFSTSGQVMGFLNLTPKIGGGYTGYYGTGNGESLNQGIFYAGIDADLKFSRRYSGIYNHALGLNGVNHIIQPHFTLAYVEANNLDGLYPQIDGQTATTLPPSLSMGRYTEIDSMHTGMIFRYGVRNVLMTSRDAKSCRWLTWDVFMDAYLYDPSDLHDFSNVYSTLRWSPVPWMELISEMQLPVLGRDSVSGCREYNNFLRFTPWRNTEILVGHRYLTGHPQVEDNDQMDLRIFQRFSEDWAVSARWRFYLDDGTMDVQEYNVHYNMGSWYLGVGTFMRKNGGKDEFGLGISFTIQESGDHLPVKFH